MKEPRQNCAALQPVRETLTPGVRLRGGFDDARVMTGGDIVHVERQDDDVRVCRIEETAEHDFVLPRVRPGDPAVDHFPARRPAGCSVFFELFRPGVQSASPLPKVCESPSARMRRVPGAGSSVISWSRRPRELVRTGRS